MPVLVPRVGAEIARAPSHQNTRKLEQVAESGPIFLSLRRFSAARRLAERVALEERGLT